jgi:hypothetical protein
VSREQILERERRWAVPAAVAAFLAFALIVAGTVVGGQGGDTDAEFLSDFSDNSGTLLLARILSGIGLGILCLPLVYLFGAAQARSETMRPALIGLATLGPLFLAIGTILGWIALDDASSQFVSIPNEASRTEDVAEELIKDSTLRNVSIGLNFAGSFGLGMGLLYSALHGMRTGLLARFWGSLGMATGVAIFLLPFGVWFLLAWFGYIGLLYLGRVPGGRPPAWEAGEAIPWPTPGEQAAKALEPDESEPPDESPGDVAPAANPRKRKRRR